MPETPLTFSIDADELDPEKFSDLIKEFIGLLGEIDRELSPTGDLTLNYRITSLSYKSPATIGMVAVPRQNQPDHGPQVIPACIRGLEMLENKRSRPPEFNDEALGHVKRLGEGTGNGVREIRVNSPVFRRADVVVTRQSVVHVERILPFGYSTGSIEGRLEALNIHGQPQFTVYDAVSGRAVRCYFEGHDLDRVIAAVGRKVIVDGQLRRDPAGVPQQVRPVEFFEVIDKPPTTRRGDAAGLFGEIDDPEHILEIIRGD